MKKVTAERIGMAAAFVILTAALLGHPGLCLAEYSFKVEKNFSDVYVDSSGAVGIEYALTFYCNPGGDPIDVVDIGMPNSHYDISSARADLNGRPLSRIRDSEYVKPGIEVHLGDSEIRPGSSGTLSFHVECGRLIYNDSEDDSYASVEFSPTWFGSQFASGTTHLKVSFHFPRSVEPGETRWHGEEFDSHSRDEKGRIVFTWEDSSASPSRQYLYGVSFPKRHVAEGAITEEEEGEPGGIGRAIETGIPMIFVLFVMAAIVGGAVAAALSQKKRLMQYLPPSVAIEGVGIKRGLMAVEAAVLLERPLDKVSTMILFGLLRKGAVRVGKDRPLRLEVVPGAGEGLEEYESSFLGAIDKKGRVSEEKLRSLLVTLIKNTNEKMKGFSRRETKEYYASIVEKAWKQVSASEAPEAASQVFDKDLEWLLMDPRYGERMTETLGNTVVFVPLWYPVHGSSSPGGVPHISVPSLPGSDFANSVVRSVEGFAHGLVSKVESFTAGITRTTNPPASGSWSGRGGSGCACACACAGCACACAGGGR